jgi:hypothetical protein
MARCSPSAARSMSISPSIYGEIPVVSFLLREDDVEGADNGPAIGVEG